MCLNFGIIELWHVLKELGVNVKCISIERHPCVLREENAYHKEGIVSGEDITLLVF